MLDHFGTKGLRRQSSSIPLRIDRLEEGHIIGFGKAVRTQANSVYAKGNVLIRGSVQNVATLTLAPHGLLRELAPTHFRMPGNDRLQRIQPSPFLALLPVQKVIYPESHTSEFHSSTAAIASLPLQAYYIMGSRHSRVFP